MVRRHTPGRSHQSSKQKPEGGELWNRKGIRLAEIKGVRIVSGYVSPNIDIEEFKKYLGRLENCIRHARLEVLVAGHLNAKSPTWGSGVEDNRGGRVNRPSLCKQHVCTKYRRKSDVCGSTRAVSNGWFIDEE
jgi:hypothetical protein